MENKFIYLDNCSTSQLSMNVLNKINYHYQKYWANPSSTHDLGIKCSEKLERIRNKIALIFNTTSEDIVFTSGSTESTEIVFRNIAEKFSTGKICISSIEHQATKVAANHLKLKGWEIIKLPVDHNGKIKMYEFNDLVNKDVKLLSCIWGHSEVGTLQPIQVIGNKCKEQDILFHLDGTQVISNGIFNWNKINCDMMSLSAHKFGGPKGIGILLTNKRSREILRNSLISKNHEYSIRAGTQSLPNIAGMYEALKNIKGRISFNDNDELFEKNKHSLLSEYLMKKISANNNIEITGCPIKRLPNHVSFILINKINKPIEAYKVVNYMSDKNVFISSGSACSSDTDKPSLTLSNMGLEQNKHYSNVRVSFSENNNYEEIDNLYNLILECINIF